MRINPARGVDLPELELSIKSPSKNYCTSEPFFSAYERLLGSEYDAIILLTDYQEAKKQPPLRLQILNAKYLAKSQIADENLSREAKAQRDWLLVKNESWAKKTLRFLAYVNQSDWRAKKLVLLLANIQNDLQIKAIIQSAEGEFNFKNAQRAKNDRPLLPDSDLDALKGILRIAPLHLGVIDAVDNWVVEMQKEFGRLPNENEWNRLLVSPLDGKITMSFALQWRFNFGKVFGSSVEEEPED